jgi:uncharacterized Ntn-hydrolase superfamily protein
MKPVFLTQNLFFAASILCLSVAPLAAAPLKVCDSSTPLTPIGIDTREGVTLLALPPLGGAGRGWIVELPAEGAAARLYPDTGRGRFGGSVGPGPVIAAMPCGPSCVQPVQWAEGAWKPLGEPFAAPAVSTLAATWDETGHAWVVLHGAPQEGGRSTAWAFRLEESDHEWHAKGSLPVRAVGPPQALPAPQRKDGVLSGTGLFAASGRPADWLSGLPELPPARRGQVLPLTGSAAAYLSGDGAVYLSRDGGKGWRRSLWTPWGGAGLTESWRQGTDFWVDMPLGAPEGRLQLAWFDRRMPSEEKLYLTELDGSAAWHVIAQGASEVRTRGEEKLAVSHLLAPRSGDWLLVSGCVATPEGSGLVVRTARAGAISAPRLVLLGTGAPPPGRLAHTYSIVARDPKTGDFGVAVQSHWFQVGPTVPWAEAGVGAVATQSFVKVDYGPRGLELMRGGASAQQALDKLLADDPQRDVRQVAMVDRQGRVATWTGPRCIAAAGHQQGAGYSVQANLMDKPTIWPAMARAYEAAQGDLAERVLAALEAAEREGGDIRGRQSAALVVVRAASTGEPWHDRLVDLRVDDDPAPLVELRRLLTLHRAYDEMNAGDDAVAANKLDEALAHYTRASSLAPEIAELPFWQAVTLFAAGQEERALPIFRQVFAREERWARLVPRLPAAGLLPDDPKKIEKILGEAKRR